MKNKLESTKIKSLFKSKIFWTIVIGVTTAITPLIVEATERGQVKPHEVISILSAGLLAGAGIYARGLPQDVSSVLPVGLPAKDEGKLLIREVVEPSIHD